MSVITNSANPVTAGAGSSLFDNQQEYSFQVDVDAVPENEIRDVNGAGDSFVGGFLARIGHFEYSRNLNK